MSELYPYEMLPAHHDIRLGLRRDQVGGTTGWADLAHVEETADLMQFARENTLQLEILFPAQSIWGLCVCNQG